MVAPASFAWSFRNVHVLRKDRVFFVAGRDSEVEASDDVSHFFVWDGAWRSEPLPLTATGICVATTPTNTILCMGIDGRILSRPAGTFDKEVVDSSESGPQNYGDLREIRTIGGLAHVVGMGRTAYCRQPSGKWLRIDEGLRTDDASEDPGLNSIDGSPDRAEYVAVGWNGEIWRRRGAAWHQLDSPTNLSLNKVVRLADASYLAAGQRGVVIHIVGDSIRVIEQSATEDDFYGMTAFRGRVFLATPNGLFSLNKQSVIEPVAIKSRKKIRTFEGLSFLQVHSSDEVIWSVGRKMAIYSEDGETWTETPYR